MATRKTTGRLPSDKGLANPQGAGDLETADGGDTDRVRPERAPVQASVVELQEPTGWGAERDETVAIQCKGVSSGSTQLAPFVDIFWRFQQERAALQAAP